MYKVYKEEHIDNHQHDATQVPGQLKTPDSKKLGFPMRLELDTNQTREQGTKVI